MVVNGRMDIESFVFCYDSSAGHGLHKLFTITASDGRMLNLNSDHRKILSIY